jgi:hypothetical protein
MINSINVRKLRNGEFNQFNDDLDEIIQRNDSPLILKSDPYLLFKSNSDRVNRLFKASQLTLVSDELASLDEQRDSTFNSIRLMLEGSLHHPQTELQKYAQALLKHLDTYGKGITRKNYPTETAILKNILEDWQTFPHLAEALSALGFTPWQNKLKDLNQRFNDLYVSRAQEAGTGQSEKMKQIRDAAGDSYYELREFINSLYVVNKKAEPFAKLINEINGLVDKYNQVASHLLTNPEPLATPAPAQPSAPTQP